MKYVENDDEWSKEVQKELGISVEHISLPRLKQLIDKGHFLKKRRIYPSLSNQKITFLELPEDLANIVMDLMTSHYYKMAQHFDRTGYYWLFGYPISRG